MTRRSSIPSKWFEAEYQRDPDPWQFATSDYESAKYAATIAALGERRFEAAFEVGCSIGVFTARLANRCDRLLAVDVSETALAKAQALNPTVRFANMRVPDAWPDHETFDLIVFSEVLYYLEPIEIHRVAAATLETLRPGGVVLLVHWTGDTDYPVSGDEAAQRFIAATAARLEPVQNVREARYRLDRLDADVSMQP